MKLAELINKYRKDNKLSQAAFGRMCGISQGTISYLELGLNPNNGKKVMPQLSQLEKLAAGMGMTVNEIFDLCEDLPKYAATTSVKQTVMNWIKHEASKEELLEFIVAASEQLKK